MPYITQDERKNINPELKKFLMFMGPMTPGQFVYVMYIMALWQATGGGIKTLPVNWTKCNEIMGNFDCVAKEFYRRVVAPYEDLAVKRNGDCNVPRADTPREGKVDPFDCPREFYDVVEEEF